MKIKELLCLSISFFLGYFANIIINIICGRPVVEGAETNVDDLPMCLGENYWDDNQGCTNTDAVDYEEYQWAWSDGDSSKDGIIFVQCPRRRDGEEIDPPHLCRCGTKSKNEKWCAQA
tara:strand:+ start:1079 stop:1432 length:354 start_codon:yes stop_codon:yes gene_type:complete